MEYIIPLIIGIAVGAVIGMLSNKSKIAAESAKNAMLQSEAERLKADAAQMRNEYENRLQSAQENAEKQAVQLQENAEKQLSQLQENAEKQLRQQQEDAAARLAAAKDEAREALEHERSNSERMRRESDRQWEQKLEALRQEMQKNAAEQLAAKQRDLQESNRTQMDELLKPIKEQFADFKKTVEESKTQNEVNKKELQNTFEATMKLFQQEQQQTVAHLKEQTLRIGSDAANLTKALKGDSKMQGDWGEMVLETILENSGLRKDEEFFIQENTKDESGHNYRPDVVVRFPEGRSVVIDSKVSLTAYTDAVAAEDEAERDRLLKAHAASVRKHIDELAEKDYSKLVDDAIGFVLMFIPNETSYIAAMRQQPDLSRYAYQKKIIIISPSNLLMALQLAYNLWQYDRQNKNVEKIVKTAADLYDKVVGFEDTFSGIGDLLTRLSTSYAKAKNQLYDGAGNVMRRVESLKSLGITPKKKMKGLETE